MGTVIDVVVCWVFGGLVRPKPRPGEFGPSLLQFTETVGLFRPGEFGPSFLQLTGTIFVLGETGVRLFAILVTEVEGL